MKKITLALVTLSTLALIGCGGGGGSSSSNGGANDAFKIKKVAYTLNGTNKPTCHNDPHITGLESSSVRMSCIWICGEYEGARPVAVGLFFDKSSSGVWEFDSDSVSTASTACHN